MMIFLQNTKLKLCQTVILSLLLVLSPPILAEEAYLPSGISAKKLDPASYVPGQLIVKLKESKTTTDLQELNSKYKVSSMEGVFKDAPNPEVVLSGLKEDLAKLDVEHQRWYWQLDKDSQEYKDYQQRIEKDKEGIREKIKRQEELIARLRRRQKRATAGKDGSSNLENIYLLKTQSTDTDISGMVEDYKESPAVEYAEPNYVAHLNTTPNDAKYSQQWAHQNTEAESGWEINTGGSDVIIAVIDSGVDYDHEDLKDNIWKDADGNPGKDFVDIKTSSYTDKGYVLFSDEDYTEIDYKPKGYHGHGTHVAGIAAAKGNNSLGVAGVCYDCKIMPVRAGFAISDNTYVYGLFEVDDIASAIKYAADNGADVINLSFGGLTSSGAETIAEVINNAYSEGAIIVASAGNEQTEDKTYCYPAALDNVIAVGATAKDDTKAYYSNYGDWVDVFAPGGDSTKDSGILSTVPTSGFLADSSGYSSSYQGEALEGTSMASPYVAGLAGLIISQYPDYTQSEIKAKITSSADNIDSLNSGYSGKLGSGRVNIFNSLLADEDPAFEVVSAVASESSGDGDGMLEEDEEASLNVEIKNTGGDAYSLQGTLSTEDSDISISTSSYEYGTIKKDGSLSNSASPFKFKPASSFIGEKIVDFSLTLTALGSEDRILNIQTHLGIKKLNSASAKDALEENRPAIDGDKIIWAYKSGDYYELYSYDLEANQEEKLSFSSSSANRRFPFLSASKLVFYDSRDSETSYKYKWPIYVYDLDSKEETLITGESESDKYYLSVSGSKIVWLEDPGDSAASVYLYDLDKGEKQEVGSAESSPSDPAISGKKIVWQDKRSGSDVYLYDLESAEESKLSPDGGSSPYGPRISGKRVVYLDSRNSHTDVYLYDLDSKEEKRITGDEANPWYCAISGKRIVYLDDRNGNSDIYLYDLNTDEEKRLTVSEQADQGVAISGNKVAWIREDETDTFNVYLTEVGADSDTQDSSAPSTPEVSDEGQYTVKADQLYAGWSSSDNESAISEYQYAIGTSSGATDTLGWESVDTDTSVTKSGLSLSEGTTYYFSVKAKNEAELWSDAGYSDGITVDSTAPSTELSGVDSDSWNKSSVTITLTASDSVSGADKTYYSTDGSDPTTAYGGPFILSDDGTYSIKYYSTDHAGNSESIKTANYQVKIDKSAPSTTVSGLENSDNWHTEAVTVTLEASDSLSGVDKTYYSTDVSSAVDVYDGPFTISEDGSYNIKYYSQDKAGNSESTKTASVKIDKTAPSTEISGLDSEGWNKSSVTITLSASDSVSGVDKTYYSADGSNPALTYSSPFTLSTEGTYTIKYYSIDKAGNSETVKSADSTIQIDTTSPNGSIKINNDASYTAQSDVVLVLSASDSSSGLSEMMFSNDNSSWSGAEAYSAAKTWSLSFGSGKKTVYAKFKDTAGNWSSVYSDTITVDSSVPAKPKVKDGREHTRSHNKLSASWLSSDKESGISEYQYSIGTAKGKTNTLDWTSAGTSTSVIVTGLDLKTGKEYYFNVKAKNGAGQWSKGGHSNGIKVKKAKK